MTTIGQELAAGLRNVTRLIASGTDSVSIDALLVHQAGLSAHMQRLVDERVEAGTPAYRAAALALGDANLLMEGVLRREAAEADAMDALSEAAQRLGRLVDTITSG